jgi:RHS repeat-associated protein
LERDDFAISLIKPTYPQITNYVYDEQNIIAEYDQNNKQIATYIHGPNIDEPLAAEIRNNRIYYHADGLGSITALTNHMGMTVQKYDYDAFGNIKFTPYPIWIKQQYMFTAREYDNETGLYYYRARYYDPKVGRFMTKDPIKLRGGINQYIYAKNNPVLFVDPMGLFCTTDFVSNYYGSHQTIDLGAVGLLSTFQNSNSVRGSVIIFKDILRLAAINQSKAMCNKCNKESQTTSFNLNNNDVTNVRGETCLFAVGQSTLFRSATCNIAANCDNRTYSFSCSLGFKIRDWFKDPLDIGIEAGGTPYRINADWSDSISGIGWF